MTERLTGITGANLQQAIQLANKIGISRDDFVGIFNMPNSREFTIIYWKQDEE